MQFDVIFRVGPKVLGGAEGTVASSYFVLM